MNDQHAEIATPVAKTLTMWATIAAGIGVNTWAEAASFASFCAAALGALYSMLLLLEWFWKRIWRPLGVKLGWVKAPAADSEMGAL